MDLRNASSKLKNSFDGSRSQSVRDVCGNKYKTSSGWLRTLGIFFIIIGALVGILMFFSSGNIITGIIIVISGVISGLLFMGFSEVIDLLTIIAEKN